MLNRNDRVSLRRNRAAVSWLSILVFIMGIWIINLYRDRSGLYNDIDYGISSLKDHQEIIKSKNKTIDSLNSEIFKLTQVKKDSFVENRPRTITPRTIVKKDTNFVKLETDTVKKDTLK